MHSSTLTNPPDGVLALRAAGLARRFGAQAVLNGLDLNVAAGEALGLVGVNGAGKTTLIKAILDLSRPDAGEVDVFGVPSVRPESRRFIGYVPERFSPPHYLRCREYLQFALALAGLPYEANAASAMLTQLDLDTAVLERPVRRLSKGMTQKLGLAAAFLARRSLYILDEPMSGLDPASRVAVKTCLAKLHAGGCTLFFTSHVLADVEELCSSIAVLDAGQIRFRGTPAALCREYAEPVLERAFLRCIRAAPAPATVAVE